MDSEKTLSQQPKTEKPEEVVEPKPIPSRLPRLTFTIIIFILLVAGYFILSSKNQQKTTNISPSEAPTTIPTINPNINWQTYTNSDLGFSIQFPEDYAHEKIDAEVTHSPYPSYSLIDLQGNGNKIEIAVAVNDNNYTLNEIIGNGPLLSYSKNVLNNENINNIEIDGVEALRIDNIPVGLAGIRSEILFIKKNKIYQIVLVPSEAQVGIFNQILSTFQFINEDTIEDVLTKTVEITLNSPPPIDYASIPQGTRLLDLKVEGNDIVINLSKEILANGMGVELENSLHLISVQIGNLGIDELKNKGFKFLIEGEPLENYRN